MTPKLRSMTAVVMAVGMAALLTGCFPVGSAHAPAPTPSETAAGPGLSREAAAELLNAVPGLRSADVGSLISGLSTEAVVEVTVDDEASIMAEGVLEYVLRVGWATEVSNEPSELSLTVRSNGALLDLQSQVNDLAGVDNEALPLLYSAYLDTPGDNFGPWPGAVPTPPAPAPAESAVGPSLSREAAAELLNAVPGLRDGDVGSVISGLTTEALVEVSVDDEASIMAEGVLDYVLRVGWATAASREPTQLSLTVWKSGTRLDLQAEANELAGAEYPAIPSLYSVHLDEPEYLGSWPGAVPTPTAG